MELGGVGEGVGGGGGAGVKGGGGGGWGGGYLVRLGHSTIGPCSQSHLEQYKCWPVPLQRYCLGGGEGSSFLNKGSNRAIIFLKDAPPV